MASSAPAQQTRLQEFLGNLPLVTMSIMAICIIVHVGSNLSNFYAIQSAFSLVPYMVLFKGEVWRIVTAAYMHGGIMHIAMNMMSLYSLGSSLEPLFGSLQFGFLLSLYTLLIGLLYVLISWALAVAWNPAYIVQGAVGFSGVLFAMAVNESALSPFPTRSIFGLFSVPTKVYPWVLMLLIQVIVPGVSLLGHLCGILIGGAHTAGWLKYLLPSLPMLKRMEGSCCMRRIARSRPYKPVPQSPVVLDRSTGPGTCAALGSFAATVLSPITHCFGGAWRRLRGGAGGSDQQRYVDDSGRLSVRSPPASAAAAAVTGSSGAGAGAGAAATATAATAPALASPDLEGGSGASASAPGWGVLGAVHATTTGLGGLGGGGGGGGSGYARVPTAEPEEGRGAAATATPISSDNHNAVAAAGMAGMDPELRAKRAASAAAAAEARLAAAAAVGKPAAASPTAANGNGNGR